MADLWTTLGYDRVASRVASALEQSDDLVVLQGPPGVGKSWLAKGIGVLWEDGGGSAIVAEGDLLNSQDALYPFGFAMAGLGAGWRRAAPALTSVAKAGETLLGTAGLITATVETLARLQHGRRRRRARPLSDLEQDILHQLERLARKRPVLLIADNLHWWDADSLELLARLRDERMWEAFPFLAELRVLAAQTIEPYQHVVCPVAHTALLRPVTTARFDLPRVGREGFPAVLDALGAPGTPDDVVDAVYACSGGHLALASRCAERIARGEGAALVAAVGSDDFIRRILGERIEALGEPGRKALLVLQIAAVLGLTFRRDELLCASGWGASETARVLRYCRDESVLVLDDEVGRFVHDLYREFFLSAGDLDRTSVHEALSDCLRRLRPGDYEVRCQNAARAERPQEAATLAVQAALQRQREGLPWRDLPSGVLEAMSNGGLTEVAERFETALEHLNAYRYTACLETLGGLPRGLARSLAAEADYVRGACLIATRSTEQRAEARAMLEGWAGYEEDEAELGVRLMQLLLYALAMLLDKSEGLRHEAHMRRVLMARAAIDPSAEDALHTLERSAGALHGPERSLLLVRDAVAHFGPLDGQSVIRRPVEYYRCLVNECAMAILNARYEAAQEAYSRLVLLETAYTPGTFPRLDYAHMNGLLAEVRAGRVSAADASRRQEQIVESHGVAGDPFYPHNAWAVYLVIAGELDRGLAIFDRLAALLRRRGDPEPSMEYLVRANRAVCRYVQGAVDEARAEWQALTDLVLRLPYVTAPSLIRRHELLSSVIADGAPMTARAFDQVLLSGRPPEFGPLWDHLGHGFWLPEIEWWR